MPNITVKLQARVDRDRKLSLQLPEIVPVGEVEVIVHAPTQARADDARQHLEALLSRVAASARSRPTQAEIDAYLAEERASWER